MALSFDAFTALGSMRQRERGEWKKKSGCIRGLRVCSRGIDRSHLFRVKITKNGMAVGLVAFSEEWQCLIGQ